MKKTKIIMAVISAFLVIGFTACPKPTGNNNTSGTESTESGSSGSGSTDSGSSGVSGSEASEVKTDIIAESARVLAEEGKL